MQLERWRPREDPAATAAALRALVAAPESVAGDVAEIIGRVRTEGDRAVIELTRRFDSPHATGIRVERGGVEAAVQALDPELRAALELAVDNVAAVAQGWLGDAGAERVDLGDHEVRLRRAPVKRAAVYVPGGRASYPSSVIMGVVTARAAGVPEVAVCAPPSAEGAIDPVVLAACGLTGADVVYGMGGAQAVAALAYGTETVAPVEMIVGPGNLYVQEAKRQVSSTVGIDGFAGPSDVMVIADGEAAPEPLALDLLAQAEHGPGTLVVAVSDAPEVLDAVHEQLAAAPATPAQGRLIEVQSLDEALALAEAFAPEHLQLVGQGAESLAPQITRSGCLFVGPGAATAFGDYVAGSNHILPTGGAARYSSGLTPGHFLRSFAELRVRDADELARAGAALARAEGFEWHARSMEARIRENDGHGPQR